MVRSYYTLDQEPVVLLELKFSVCLYAQLNIAAAGGVCWYSLVGQLEVSAGRDCTTSLVQGSAAKR